MPGDSPLTDDEAFEALISPLREALRDLLEVSDQLRDEWGSLPNPESRAMAELDEETRFARPGRHPAQAAHDLSRLLLLGMTDCARAAIRLLSSDPTPVYAHVVLARASLEHAGRAWWLLDPGIDVRLRVARAMTERLHGYEQQARLPLNDEDRQRNRELREALLAEADDLGFERIGSTPFVAENRPGQTELVRQLLGVRDDRRLGDAVYGLFSAVAHGTIFGLANSVTMDHPNLPTTPGVEWGAVVTTSQNVVVVLAAIGLGALEAFRRRNELFGYQSRLWSEKALSVMDAAKRSLSVHES